MLHHFVPDERAEFYVESFEVFEDGFDGVWKVLQPRHHVHDAPRAHGLSELVVSAHYLPELLVLVRVALTEAQRTHDVGRGHHQII